MFNLILSAKTAFTLWQAYNTHLRLGHKWRTAMYKFILANSYSKPKQEYKLEDYLGTISWEPTPEPKDIPTLKLDQVLAYASVQRITHESDELPWSLSLTDTVHIVTIRDTVQQSNEATVLEAMKVFTRFNLGKYHPDVHLESCEYCTDGDGLATPLFDVTPHYNNYGHCIALTV